MKIKRVDKWAFYKVAIGMSKLALHLPAGTLGDRMFAFFLFLERQGRLPKGRMDGFQDYLYSMKKSGELLSLPRQMVSDKEYGKLFINDVLGGPFAVPTLRVLRAPDEVVAEAFPPDCAIKPTHASQKVIIRRNNAPIDLEEIRSFFDADLYREGREQNYRYLEHKVIVEPIVFDGADFIELNLQCYKGRAKLMSVKCEGGKARERRDRDWNEVDIVFTKPKPKVPVPKPESWDDILHAVETIASRFEYIRVDLYTTGTEFLIGEITNCHTNAVMKFKREGDADTYKRLLFGSVHD